MQVYLVEALMFLFLYFAYIAIVVVLVYVGPWLKVSCVLRSGHYTCCTQLLVLEIAHNFQINNQCIVTDWIID